jgi:high-affinity Fe2+/Pb2+ permease
MSEQPLTLRETARGVAVRAGVLVVGGIVIGGWITALLFKAAGGLMKILIGLLLVLITGGLVTYEVKRVQKRIAGP